MTLQRGAQTSEFWLSAIGTLTAVLMPLLVAYGVLSKEESELWTALILGVVSVVVPLVVGSVVKNYNDGRVAVKTEAIKLETQATQLEVMRLESLNN